MAKYGIYQKGLLGEDLQTNYDRQNVFDLAGGMSFTIWQNADSEGYMSAVSLSFTSKSMRLKSGAGEFGGFGFTMVGNEIRWEGIRTWNKTISDIKTVANTLYREKEMEEMVLSEVDGDGNLGRPSDRQITNWLKKKDVYLFGIKVGEKREYYNSKEPFNKELWEKAKNGDEAALKELFKQFTQQVTMEEDAADKTQRAIDKIMEDAEKGKFGMGIKGDRAKELLNILKGGNTIENNRKFEKFRKDFIKEKADEMKKNTGKNMKDEEEDSIKAYLNGLKYIYDNKNTAAVHIISASCAIISDYLLAGLTGKFDPTKVSYSDFYKAKFEKGEIGDNSSYTTAPVWVRSFGWGNNKPFVVALNYRQNIDGKEILAYIRPDLYGKDKNVAIEYQGITAEELEGLKDNGAYSRLFEKINEFPKNLDDLYDSLGNGEWYMVQRKESYNDTHFFIMKKVGNEYKLYDHNWVFSRYRWGSSYNSDRHYISRYIWYK